MRFPRSFAFASAPSLAASLAALALLSVAACSSSDDGGGGGASPGGVDGGASEGGASEGPDGGCTSSDFALTPLAGGEVLVDVAVGKAGPTLLVRRREGALAVVQAGGARKELEASGATAAALSARPDGEVCVLWGLGTTRGQGTSKTACSPSYEAVETGVTLTMSDRYPLGYRNDGPQGSAAVFAATNSLDGMAADGVGAWRDANLMESSTSFGGGPRALSGATRGAPYCYVVNGTVAVERWLESGAANTIGAIAVESSSTFDEDVGCGVATVGEGIGVMAVGAGKAKFAVQGTGSEEELVETPLDATGIGGWSFGTNGTHFVGVYDVGGAVFRAKVAVAGGAPEVTPVALPNAAKSTGKVAVAFDAAGAEHLAVQTSDGVLLAKTCR